MAPMLEPYGWLTVVYWALMTLIAAWILVQVTNFFAEDAPGTWFGAIVTVLSVFGAAYLTYDVFGYVLLRMMQDPELGIQLPPDYSLWKWLFESPSLKWHVLGYVPFVRFLPIVFALCMGGTIQVFLWSVPFRTGLVIFVLQILFNLCAMALLSMAMTMAVAASQGRFENPEFVREWTQGTADRREAGGRPENLRHLSRRVRAAPRGEPGWLDRASDAWSSVNRRLDPLYQRLQPATDHFPPPVQTFLNSGGWILVFLGVLTLAWRSRSVFNRWKTNRKRKKRKRSPDPPIEIDEGVD